GIRDRNVTGVQTCALPILIPAVCWGIFPLIASKTGGGPANQILGTGLGATLVGLIVFAIMHPTITASAFIWAFMAGACWTIGQIGQFISMKPERKIGRAHV